MTDFATILKNALADPETRAYWDDTNVCRELGVWLIKYRVKNGMTQTQLAAELGIQQRTVSRIESCEHQPTLQTLQTIAKCLRTRFTLTIEPDKTTLST